jgi:hypothetical protein
VLTVFSNNYLHLGGTGMLDYEWTLSDGTSAIAGYKSSLWPGVNFWATPPLAPGEYTTTIVVTEFPEMTETATFTIHDCAAAPANPGGSPVVHDLTTACSPGDHSETIFFFVTNPGPATDFGWTISDGHAAVAVSDPWGVRWYLDGPNLMVIRHLPVGSLEFSAVGIDDPSITLSTALEVGPCGDPADPTDATDPADPVEPAETTDPADPADPGDTPGIGQTGDAGETTQPPVTGTLPATR